MGLPWIELNSYSERGAAAAVKVQVTSHRGTAKKTYFFCGLQAPLGDALSSRSLVRLHARVAFHPGSRAASHTRMGKKGGRGGRKLGGGGRRHANKDHRQSGLKHTVNKGRWDDICARQLAPGVAEKVLAEKTVPDPDLPGLGQYFCIACRHAGPAPPSRHARPPPGRFPFPRASGGSRVLTPCSAPRRRSKYCISAQALADHQRTPKHRRAETESRRRPNRLRR